MYDISWLSGPQQKNQFLKIKKAEPRSRPVRLGSQPYTVLPSHLDPCPHHRWSGARVVTVAVVGEPRRRGADAAIVVVVEESMLLAESKR
jgi:hypothetical protein